MRKLRGQSNDSMDLLLDTLCNVFGSIILIACLLALLTRDQEVMPPTMAEGEGQLLERRIEAANAELAGLKQLLAEIANDGDPQLRQLAAEREELRQTQERLRGLKSKASEEQARSTQASVLDPGKELTALRMEVQRKEQELAEAASKVEAARQKRLELEKRTARINAETRASEAKRVVKLRFPKERAITKGAMPVIVQHGEIFPLQDNNGSRFAGITYQSTGVDSFKAIPKRHEGWSLPSRAESMRQIAAACKSRGTYLTLYVYGDSFEVFRELKELIHQTGCDYGVDVCDDEQVLRFGSSGSSPAPL